MLLAWDPDTQTGSEGGIVGKLDAWGMAAEEQARKTLHAHLLLWSKKLSEMRDAIFDGDETKRKKARADFEAHIDTVMCASYRDEGTEWIVKHMCKGVERKAKVEDIFKECDRQVLRDARHKVLCHDINGNVMECEECGEKISPQSIINLTLNEWHQNALRDSEKKTSASEDLTFPLSRERHDIAMYRTSYDEWSGSYDDDPFWGKKDVRRILQISGDNEHFALHGPRCFKKGQECTSGSFPQAACERTCIHEDMKLEGEDTTMLEWYLLDGSIKRTAPWMILPRRPLGSQYLNTHNLPISTIFNCNSNVIIGDASNTFYLTLYGSKSTQKEDGEKKERIMKKLIRRLRRLQMERERNLIEDEEDNDKGDFVQGLSMMMSAMNASTSRDVVSSTMAHYLVTHGGSRFSASHKPKHLLLKQLEETLDGKAVNFILRRTNKSKEDGTMIQWPESTSDDYLYRPKELEHICAYEFTELYEKKYYSLKEIDDGKQGEVVAKKKNRGDRYRFHEDHPGYEFAYIERMRLPAVAVVSIPEGKLCLLKDLELDSDTPSQIAKEKREDYAKMALMMFYPFRPKPEPDGKLLAELKIGGSYWTLFNRERIGYFKGEKTVFWKTGFEILQNIEDREMMMQSDKRVRARDPVLINTMLNEDEAQKQKSEDNKNMIPDISQFCDDDESIYAESDADDEEGLGQGFHKKWSHDVLVGKVKNITNDRLISARLSSDESIFQRTGSCPMQEEVGLGENEEPSTAPDEDWFKNKSYPTLLKFVSGTLVGPTNYDDIYGDDLMEINTCDNVSDGSDDESVHVVTQDDMPQTPQEDTTGAFNIPTLVGVARKVAQQDKMKLDEKQYIAYEIIACTFLLELVEEGRDKSSILGQYLGSALGSIKEDTDLLVENLKARGGMSQLLMFLTGPAGAGKSTAVKVAQRFCFEFCAAVSVMWHDETFYFTACSGSAAALFRGVTIHSGAFMNGRVTDAARKEWKNVRILMIDEISYLSDNDFKKLDRKLKDLNGIPNKPFGGQSIIFSGDFRQFEAILAKYLLYDRFGSRHWENSINCVIILENIHRFKDDPEYGQMLTRLWRDDLTQEDREKINTRVVGQNGVTLPPTFDGDVVYACATNKERNAFQAGIFRDHILSTHPKVNSPELPPDHTIIIEAVVQSSKSKKSASSIGSFTRDRIIHTCGDADCVLNDSKYIDPALRLYVGAHCMCIVDNKRLKDKVPIGNGTLCRVVGIKLKDHAPSRRWQNWDGRKVWTVSAKHVDWVEFEYHPKSKRILELEEEIKEKEWDLKVLQESCDVNQTRKRAKTTRRHTVDTAISDLHKQLQKLEGLLRKEQQSRRFKLDPQTSSPTVSYTVHALSTEKVSAKCRMTQIPVVLADCITGHKLQGMTIPHVIIASWGYFAKNWPYVVLSRSTTFEGLYLFQPIDMEKSFAPSRDLVEYLRRAENLQDHILRMRKTRMAEVNRHTE